MSKKPVVLMILDGYGESDIQDSNAVFMAKTPVMDKLKAECPYQKGLASGMAVGLPDGQMGNSEVGHMNIRTYHLPGSHTYYKVHPGRRFLQE